MSQAASGQETRTPWLLYGATGYTGRRIAAAAVARGHRPVLAGRRRSGLEALAKELGCPHKVFAVEETADHLEGTALVLNCAGPFSRTALPMIEACLARGAHYVDITGEIDVIEAAAILGEAAEVAGVVLLPAAGFDVVPTDCLAALVAAEVPGASSLEIAFAATGGLSPGTAKTVFENMPQGGRIRREGKITRVPLGWKTRKIPFSDHPRTAISIPWGDVSSAYHTTGIPNITVYMAASRIERWMTQVGRLCGPIFRWGPAMAFGQKVIGWLVRGPTETQLERSRAYLWAAATDDAGRAAEATMETPGGYVLTVITALDAVERVLATRGLRGFRTPSQVLGSDYMRGLAGATFAWLKRPGE